jgi:hypothetical protein
MVPGGARWPEARGMTDVGDRGIGRRKGEEREELTDEPHRIMASTSQTTHENRRMAKHERF